MKLKPILLAGLTVGILDGISAVLSYLGKGGNKPEIVFKFISSGILGNTAFGGGYEIVALGILLHFVIALGWSFIFFLFYPKVPEPYRNKYVFGPLYGLIVWGMMQFVVIPMSSTPPVDSSAVGMLIGIGIHFVAVGLPIAVVFHRYNDGR